MARRRGGFRSVSVPVTFKRVIIDDAGIMHEPSMANKTEMVSRHALDDAELLSRKSRSRDKQLLDDITQKMMVSTFAGPYRRAANFFPRPASQGALFVIAGSEPPPLRPRVEEQHYYLQASAPPRPSIYHRTFYPQNSHRAESEPPRSRGSRRANESADFAIRNARRYMDKVERELGMHGGEPMFDEPVVYQSRAPVATAARYQHHVAPHHVYVPPHHVYVPPPSPISSRVRVAQSPVHVVPMSARVLRSASLPPPNPGTIRRSRIPDIETRIEAQVYPDLPHYTYSTLRARTNNARSKMDVQKSLLDRYLPVYLGPVSIDDVNYEIDEKYAELLRRMPSLDPYKPNPGYMVDNNVPHHKPPPAPLTRRVVPLSTGGGGGGRSTNYNLPPRGSALPPVSATRRHLRDVICATRHDPTYFNE